MEATTHAVTVVGQLPPQIDLIIYQGDDFVLDLTVTVPIQPPPDISNWTAKAEVRAKIADIDPIALFDCSVLAADKIRLHLSAVESAKLVDKAVWDVQIEDGGGYVQTLAFGVIILTKQVTR